MHQQQHADKTLKFIYDSNLGEVSMMIFLVMNVVICYHMNLCLMADGLLYRMDMCLPCILDRYTHTDAISYSILPMRSEFMRGVHLVSLAAHPGIAHMCDKNTRKAWWPSFRKDVASFCFCLVLPAWNTKSTILKKCYHVLCLCPDGPIEHTSLSMSLHLCQRPSEGNKFVLVIVDRIFSLGGGRADEKEQNMKNDRRHHYRKNCLLTRNAHESCKVTEARHSLVN